MSKRANTDEPRPYTARFEPDQWERMTFHKQRTNEDFMAQIRRGVDMVLEGAEQPTISLPILASVPCGPWEEAINDSSIRLLLNDDWRRELDAREDDLLVRTYGQSMEGAHILDGSLLLIGRLAPHKLPREGQPALVQYHEDGQAFSTIKSWHMKNGKPLLRDGDGKEVKLSPKTERLEAVGVVKRAVIEF